MICYSWRYRGIHIVFAAWYREFKSWSSWWFSPKMAWISWKYIGVSIKANPLVVPMLQKTQRKSYKPVQLQFSNSRLRRSRTSKYSFSLGNNHGGVPWHFTDLMYSYIAYIVIKQFGIIWQYTYREINEANNFTALHVSKLIVYTRHTE